MGWENGQGLVWKWMDLNDRLAPPAVQSNLVPNAFLWWWQDSRVINDRTLTGDHVEVIDEFPAFTYIMGDLHPHVLAYPFLIAVLAIVLEILLRGSEGWPESLLERWLFILFAALSIGSLIFLNTWDVLVLGMAGVAGWVGWNISRKELTFARFSGWKAYLARWATIGFLSVAFYIPFLIGFSSQLGGILPNVLFPTKGIQFFIMFGTLLIPITIWASLELIEKRGGLDWRRALAIVGTGLAILIAGSLVMSFVLALSPSILNALAGTLGGFAPIQAISIRLIQRLTDPLASLWPAFLIFASLAVILGWIRKRRAQDSEQPDGETSPDGIKRIDAFVWILIFWGALLVLCPEYFYLRDLFGDRMNTVFKFYFQGWAFWSLAASYGAIRIFQILTDKLEQDSRRWSLAGVGALLTAVCFILGGLFLPMAVVSKTNNFQVINGRTLDASAYLKQNYPDDAAAIAWINANIHDLGPIAEAVGGSYSEFARIATFTGLSNVIGWPFHEEQWRGPSTDFQTRENDVKELYTTTDWTRAQQILDEYGIRYVYFGPLEASTYKTRGLDKFRAHMNIIYQTDQVTIFERDVP